MTGQRRFLAIDDDPAFLLILVAMMEELGYGPILTARSAREGLEILARGGDPIDCVLLDIQMPEMDGIAACRRIRAMPRHRDTPIVMITTMKARRFVEAAFDAGATDYLTKPLDRIELQARLGMVERLLAEREQARMLAAEMNSIAGAPWLQFDFADAIELRDSDSVIDYRALQNYVLTLNRLKLFACGAVGFCLVGASRAFSRLDRLAFHDYLCDVGDAIAAALKEHRFKLAYAGGGVFVAVLDQAEGFDKAEVEAAIAQNLAFYEPLYRPLGVAMPSVRVGEMARLGVFMGRSPAVVIERARERALRSDAP